MITLTPAETWAVLVIGGLCIVFAEYLWNKIERGKEK